MKIAVVGGDLRQCFVRLAIMFRKYRSAVNPRPTPNPPLLINVQRHLVWIRLILGNL